MGAGNQLNSSELKIDEIAMCYTKVTPMGLPPQLPPPPDRPSKIVVKRISRNLWGSPEKGETDALLAKLQKDVISSVKERFGIDLEAEEENDNQQISALNKSHSAMEFSMPKTQLQGIKRTFPVRKANILISNVPKRKRDNLSSELEINGQKEKNVQQPKKEEEQQQAEKVEKEEK